MLTALLVLLVLFILGAFVWFVSPKLSPIPYFPTLNTDLKLIDKGLSLKPGDCLFDLGAGDGKMLLRYARPGIKVVGVEVNPYLVLVMKLRRLFYRHKDEIEIIAQDLFQTDISHATKIYLFVGPFLMERIVKYIQAKKGPGLKRVVSYRYDPFLWTKSKPQSVTCLQGEHPVYIWKLGSEKAGHVFEGN